MRMDFQDLIFTSLPWTWAFTLTVLRPSIQDQAHNQSVQPCSDHQHHGNAANIGFVLTEHLSKDQDQHHAHEHTRLLCKTSDTCITSNAQSEPGGKPAQSDCEAGAEVDECCIERQLNTNVVGDDDAGDEAVYCEDAGEDCGEEH